MSTSAQELKRGSQWRTARSEICCRRAAYTTVVGLGRGASWGLRSGGRARAVGWSVVSFPGLPACPRATRGLHSACGDRGLCACFWSASNSAVDKAIAARSAAVPSPAVGATRGVLGAVLIKYARIRSVVPSSCAAGCRAYIGWLPKPLPDKKADRSSCRTGTKEKQGCQSQVKSKSTLRKAALSI